MLPQFTTQQESCIPSPAVPVHSPFVTPRGSTYTTPEPQPALQKSPTSRCTSAASMATSTPSTTTPGNAWSLAGITAILSLMPSTGRPSQMLNKASQANRSIQAKLKSRWGGGGALNILTGIYIIPAKVVWISRTNG